MTSISVGAKITSLSPVSDHAAGDTATVIFIDEMDNVFIEWSDGKLNSLPEGKVMSGFAESKKIYSRFI